MLTVAAINNPQQHDNPSVDHEREHGHHSASRSSRLVWMLVLLGVGLGAFTLFVVRSALANVRAQRVALARVHDATGDLATEMGRDFAQAQSRMQALLSPAAGAGAVTITNDSSRASDPIMEMC